MKRWQCSVCGYIHTGDEPPEKCPVCGADKSMFKLMEEDDAIDESGEPMPQAPPASDLKKSASTDGVTKWRCTVCGYIHTGDEPPDKCPVCGADKSLFVPVEDSPDESSSAQKEPTQEPSPSSTRSVGKPSRPVNSRQQQIEDLMRLLTKFHGHPIAVHLPNGLLPIAVFFTFMAIALGSDSFAIAARYNMGMVALAMPLVIATGIIDWRNRFNSAMTIVFKVKIACAAVVTLLSIILAIWWIVHPDIYNSGVSQNGIFILFNLLDLAAAGLAGWYGGKLVFHN